MRTLFQAIGFLTVLPVPASGYEREQFGRSAVWFPFTGLLIGVFLAALAAAANQVFPGLVAPVIVVAGWAWITGGLHLDGLADCCDGCFAAAAPARRLEIMRDPRMGAFGGIGLILFLFLKIAAVASIRGSLALPGAAHVHCLFALLYAPVAARYTLLFVAKQPPARPGGMGDAFAQGLGASALLAGAVLPLALLALDENPLRAAIALGAAHLAALLAIVLARSRLGGMTGDVLGLSVEVSELAVLLVYAAKLA